MKATNKKKVNNALVLTQEEMRVVRDVLFLETIKPVANPYVREEGVNMAGWVTRQTIDALFDGYFNCHYFKRKQYVISLNANEIACLVEVFIRKLQAGCTDASNRVTLAEIFRALAEMVNTVTLEDRSTIMVDGEGTFVLDSQGVYRNMVNGSLLSLKK